MFIIRIVRGAAMGTMTMGFIVLTWSWYTPWEIPLRLLAWATGSQLVELIFLPIGQYESAETRDILTRMVHTLLALACIPLSSWAYYRFGTPTQVRWMETVERRRFAAAAAASDEPNSPGPVFRVRSHGVQRVSCYVTLTGRSEKLKRR